jgi:hypothetical protein
MRRDCWFKKPTKNNAAIGGHMMRDCSFKKPTKKKKRYYFKFRKAD